VFSPGKLASKVIPSNLGLTVAPFQKVHFKTPYGETTVPQRVPYGT